MRRAMHLNGLSLLTRIPRYLKCSESICVSTAVFPRTTQAMIRYRQLHSFCTFVVLPIFLLLVGSCKDNATKTDSASEFLPDRDPFLGDRHDPEGLFNALAGSWRSDDNSASIDIADRDFSFRIGESCGSYLRILDGKKVLIENDTLTFDIAGIIYTIYRSWDEPDEMRLLAKEASSDEIQGVTLNRLKKP